MDADSETEREFLDSGAGAEQGERRYRLMQSVRAVRDARFKPAVLRAYSHQCAVCPISLNLVDAAHIVPVRSARSTDDVTNGMAHCRLHHAAYDAGLIGVRPDYTVVINPAAIERLQALGFLRGLAEFNALALSRIRHPTVADVRPDPEMLRLGMQERNWPENLIG